MKRGTAAIQDPDVPRCSKRTKPCSHIYIANAAPPPMTVTLHQEEYEPTPAFDAFWRLAAERHAIDEKRRVGVPAR